MSVTTRPTAPAARAGRRRLRGRKWTRQLGDYAFVAPAAIFIGIFALYPIYYAITGSFHNVTLSTLLTGTETFVGFGNYRQIFSDPSFTSAVQITVVFVALTVVIQFVIAFGFALLFNMRFPLSRFLRATVLIPFVLPTIVTGTIFTWILQKQTGVFNYLLTSIGLIRSPIGWLSDTTAALISVIIASVWLSVPFYMSLLLAGLQAIPPTLYEAASVDGANAWQKFWRITLPQMRGPVLITLVLGIIFTSNAFDVIYIMTAGGPLSATTTLPIYAYKAAFETFNYGTAFATTTLIFLVLLLVGALYIWLTRHEAVGE